MLVDLKNTPMALFDLDREFRVTNPYIIPRSKLLSNLPDTTSSLERRFYLANAVSCFGKEANNRQDVSLLVIPDSLLTGPGKYSARFLLLRTRKSDFRGTMKGLLIADSVLWFQ